MDCFPNIDNSESGLHNMYKTIDNRRTTRKSGTTFMKIPNVKSSIGRKAYTNNGRRFWYSLDTDTRCIEDKPDFKMHISKVICHDVNHPG